jgi:DNA sulfur modification protein DndC
MLSLSQVPTRYCPTTETLAVLNDRTWLCSYSGGKDSTALVTWIEWLRRVGMVRCQTPRLVMSDTGVEYPFLRGIADRLMAALTASGWLCEVVTPPINQRLYNRIFGIGNTPVHPGGRKRMRWCTRATKIDPMKGFSRTLAADVLNLSGVRWGESDARDGKLKKTGCAAGGECGLPEPGEGVYGPIITWTVCKVLDWLNGEPGAAETISDLLPPMRGLVEVYGVQREGAGLFDVPPRATALRFGCIGCPAISNEKITQSRNCRERPEWSHLRRIYAIWDALYARKNRCCRIRTEPDRRRGEKPASWAARIRFGPLKMAARQHYFAELLDIQRQAGVTLVTPEDEAFVRDCWARKVYPRGWSEADELVVPPEGELLEWNDGKEGV